MISYYALISELIVNKFTILSYAYMSNCLDILGTTYFSQRCHKEPNQQAKK